MSVLSIAIQSSSAWQQFTSLPVCNSHAVEYHYHAGDKKLSVSYHRWPALMGICLFWHLLCLKIVCSCRLCLLNCLIIDCVLLSLFVKQSKISSSSSSVLAG